MNVSIIAVGTELLFGQTVNTNATYISNQLNLMGFNVMYHHVVGDNPGRLKELIKSTFTDNDIIIFTGGLGPTQDDLTKEIVAEAMGVELYFDERCYAKIKSYFDDRNRIMPENNRKQAYIPVGAEVFHNEAGTAPAFGIEKDGKCAICLPGPPREMKWLFNNCVTDYLKKFSSKEMYYRVIRTIGIGESDLETKLLPVINNQVDPTVATYAKEGECTLRVASQRETEAEAQLAVDNMVSEIEKLVGNYIYSFDDEELSEVVVKQLKEKELKLSSAESCTGGLFASCITDVPGASSVFSYGFVTYSAAAKSEILDVDIEVIENHSVVSAEVAILMAKGAQSAANSDISVSVTGYAGPEADPGRDNGNAYIGYSCSERFGEKCGYVEINTKRSDRKWNRNYFKLRMLLVVYEILNGKLS